MRSILLFSTLLFSISAFAGKTVELQNVELKVCDICEDTMLFIDHVDFIGESCPLSKEIEEAQIYGEDSDYVISSDRSGELINLTGKVKSLGKNGPTCFDIKIIKAL